MEKIRTTVRLAGQEFRLSCEESEEYIQQIAKYVNVKISEIQNMYPSLSSANAVLLASMNLADELFQLRTDYDALDSRISQLREMPARTAPSKRPFENKQPVSKGS